MSPKLIDEDTLRAREDVIMEAAQKLINKIGAASLTMDKVVAEVPYSKGTVYNHFSGKEDLLIALCNGSMRTLISMFNRSMSIDISSRDKMLAVGFAYMLYAYLYPDKFMLVITAKTPSVSEKASPARHDEHIQLESELLELAAGTITQAISDGDLEMPEDMNVEQVTFAFWSSAFGTISLLSEKVERCGTRSEMLLEQAIVQNSNLLFDGLGWRPLTDPERISSVIQRLKETVFTEEMALVCSQGKQLHI